MTRSAKRARAATETTTNGQQQEQQLSHEDIWDDSVLLDSWESALQEYKKYHSLHARGITVSKALERHDAAELAGVKDPIKAVFESGDEADKHMTQEDEQIYHDEGQAQTYTEDGAIPQDSEVLGAHEKSAEAYAGANTQPDVPGALFNGAGPAADNPALKNLMMSWYYAGYYTGLHEGEQKALAQLQNANKNQSDHT